MPMYKLLQYSSNYSNTTSSLWFYSKDKAINFHDNFADNVAFESYQYKTKLVGETEAQPAPNNNNGILKNATIFDPLKYLSNFWRSLEILDQLQSLIKS